MTGSVAANDAATFSYSQSAVLYIFRQQGNIHVGYAFDTWGYASVIGGVESSDVVISISSSKTVTISNARSGAVMYLAIIM